MWLSLLSSMMISAPVSASTLSEQPTENYAWFLRTDSSGRPFDVHWCVAVSDARTKGIVAEIAFQAMDAWRMIADTYSGIGPSVPASKIRQPAIADIYFGARECDGTEDLTIFYGGNDKRVVAARAAFDNPVGFAQLESYDENRGWGRGFIWLSDQLGLQNTDALYAVLLHEVGHVYGMGHIAGTIMDEHLADIIQGGIHMDAGMGAPGAEKWMNLNRNIGAPDYIFMDFSEVEVIAGSDRAQALEALLHEPVTGKVTLDYRDTYTTLGDSTRQRRAYLSVFGNSCLSFWHFPYESCAYEFSVQFGEEVFVSRGEAAVFRKRYAGHIFSDPLLASLQPGTFIDSSGRKAEFLIRREFNAGTDLFILDRQGHPKLLSHSD